VTATEGSGRQLGQFHSDGGAAAHVSAGRDLASGMHEWSRAMGDGKRARSDLIFRALCSEVLVIVPALIAIAMLPFAWRVSHTGFVFAAATLITALIMYVSQKWAQAAPASTDLPPARTLCSNRGRDVD
jgi:hypothetical protein